MLRKLTIENFFSIKEAETLDLTIARNATDPDGRFAQPIPSSTARFPKVAVLFGANASGKTNVLKALSSLAHFVRDSATWPPNQDIPLLPFGIADGWGHPVRLSVEFDAGFFEGETERKVYVYSLETTGDGKRVLGESLRYVPHGKPRWLFRRVDREIETGHDFPLAKRDPVREKVRDNASVVSTLAQFNHPVASAIYRGLEGLQTNVTIIGKFAVDEKTASRYYAAKPEVFDAFKREVQKFDLGITDVTLIPSPNGPEPQFTHAGLRSTVRYAFESQGTQNIYRMYPYLAWVLECGGVAVMDEMDGDIHPLLLPEIVRRFQDQDSNPRNAQLIMSCHNPVLLEHLVKEEVYFTEKDDQGRTHIYGLKDVAAVRRDTNLYAKYLAGAFGAVPRVA